MLHRLSKEGLICITQPNHAWVSGQLAQAWGNEVFGEFAPREEVCLSAAQHDIGWINWEKLPTLNRQTGYPHKFTEVPTQEHISMWSDAKQLAMPLGEYVTLLVSLHGTGLYERFRSWQNSPESTQIVQDFLEREYAFQEQLTNALTNDLYYATYVTPEVIDRNRKLIVTWDALSLIVCQGLTGERQVSQVPTADGEITLNLRVIEEQPHQLTVSPWPFRDNEVTLIYKGQLLREPFTDETAMRDALSRNCGVTLTTTLKPE